MKLYRFYLYKLKHLRKSPYYLIRDIQKLKNQVDYCNCFFAFLYLMIQELVLLYLRMYFMFCKSIFFKTRWSVCVFWFNMKQRTVLWYDLQTMPQLWWVKKTNCHTNLQQFCMVCIFNSLFLIPSISSVKYRHFKAEQCV